MKEATLAAIWEADAPVEYTTCRSIRHALYHAKYAYAYEIVTNDGVRRYSRNLTALRKRMNEEFNMWNVY